MYCWPRLHTIIPQVRGTQLDDLGRVGTANGYVSVAPAGTGLVWRRHEDHSILPRVFLAVTQEAARPLADDEHGRTEENLLVSQKTATVLLRLRQCGSPSRGDVVSQPACRARRAGDAVTRYAVRPEKDPLAHFGWRSREPTEVGQAPALVEPHHAVRPTAGVALPDRERESARAIVRRSSPRFRPSRGCGHVMYVMSFLDASVCRRPVRHFRRDWRGFGGGRWLRVGLRHPRAASVATPEPSVASEEREPRQLPCDSTGQ